MHSKQFASLNPNTAPAHLCLLFLLFPPSLYPFLTRAISGVTFYEAFADLPPPPPSFMLS